MSPLACSPELHVLSVRALARLGALPHHPHIAPKPPKQGLDKSLDRDQRYLVPQNRYTAAASHRRHFCLPVLNISGHPELGLSRNGHKSLDPIDGAAAGSIAEQPGRPLRRGHSPTPGQLLGPLPQLGPAAPPRPAPLRGSRGLAWPIGSGGWSRVRSRGSASRYLMHGESLLCLSVRRPWAR